MSQWNEQLVRAEHANRVRAALNEAEARRALRARRVAEKADRSVERANRAVAHSLEVAPWRARFADAIKRHFEPRHVARKSVAVVLRRRQPEIHL